MTIQVLNKQLIAFVRKATKHIHYKVNYWSNISLPQYLIAALLPKRVQYGPFRGMYYLGQSTGSVILPKLIGSYENELLPVLEMTQRNNYDLFIDIGAAEGYYAVGIYKYIFNETIPCIAFESTSRGQKQINRLAALNKVHSIRVQGFCDEHALNHSISGKKAFIIMDIEGGEFNLLDPQKVPSLVNSDILVELHPETFTTIKEVITARFELTHSIKEYEKSPTKSFPTSIHLPSYLEPFKQYMLDEFRGKQSWLHLKAKCDH